MTFCRMAARDNHKKVSIPLQDPPGCPAFAPGASSLASGHGNSRSLRVGVQAGVFGQTFSNLFKTFLNRTRFYLFGWQKGAVRGGVRTLPLVFWPALPPSWGSAVRSVPGPHPKLGDERQDHRCDAAAAFAKRLELIARVLEMRVSAEPWQVVANENFALVRQAQVAVFLTWEVPTAAPALRWGAHRFSPAPRSCRRLAARSRGRGWLASNPLSTHAPGRRTKVGE